MPEETFSTLFEDEHLVAADKPAGIHTAPLARGETGTLLHYLIERYPEIALVRGFKPVEPGLLHRLDKETSGIVIAARTDFAFMKLKEEFDRGEAVKEYVAVCARDAGNGAEGQETGAPVIGRGLPAFRIESRFAPFGPGGRRVRVVPLEGGGKALLKKASAETYATEARIERRNGIYLLVRARISKGFRHQVRAHLAHLGMPIVGDPLYGAPASPEARPRMYLHATLVEVRHPVTGALLRVVSPMPEAFAAFFPASD